MQDAELGAKFPDVGKVLLMRFSNPDASVLLDCTTNPPQVTTRPAGRS